MRHLRRKWQGQLLLPVLVFLLTIVFGACGESGPKGGYGEGQAIEVTGDQVTVEMKDILFKPKAIRIRPGTTVSWVNNDPVIHNVVSINSAFRSKDEMQQGERFTFRFDTPGSYRYQCTFHPPNMIGVVIVQAE